MSDRRAPTDCDAVIVGSGPAGATTADVLTAAGWSVIILEKGRNHLLELHEPFGPLGHVSNDEIKFQRRHFLGPDPWLEPRTFRRGQDDGERLLTGEVNNLPSTVGGGGFHADGKLPRFREDDFRPLSIGGPVDGAALADWPVDYDEMEPYYAAAERVLGVAGEAGANPFASWRADPFPMPPGPDMFCATLTTAAAEPLGFHPYRAPTGVNSVEYDGRPACNNCGYCAFFGCPIEAKGDPVAPLRSALRTGRCEIRPEAFVSEVLLDRTARRARGVRYLDRDRVTREVSARHVVLAGGAFETPRLLLRNGLGNPDVVGRFLQFHFQTLVLGIFPFRLHAHRGRAVTHLMDDPIVADAAARAAAATADLPFLRGGIVEHGGAGHPIMEALHLPSGAAHTQLMVDSPTRDRMAVLTMQGEDLPQAVNRIDLDPGVRDVFGFPAGRVTYSPHRHEIATAEHWGPRLEAILRGAGADHTFWVTSPPIPGSRADRPGFVAPTSRHIMGTARMGDDPARSVFDRWQRLHGVDNIMCADSSVFPTSSGYGPTLTIAALAIRAARALADQPPLRSERPASAP
ncbi:MAG TPA: GMC family oxidoreductase [Acidimicrobiia bacterium]|nr:GMC family oxidoreductase [Acidimicrobiia bacterium]